MTENEITTFSDLSLPCYAPAPATVESGPFQNPANATLLDQDKVPRVETENGSSVGGRKHLQLALPADGYAIEKDQYALVPMPSSYNEARYMALEIFRPFIGANTTVNELILKASFKNRKDEWCWAAIRPQDWNLTTQPGISEEVGVFMSPIRMYVPLEKFTIGKIGLVYGRREKHGIKWEINPKYPLVNPQIRICDLMIDRPRSYEEAVAVIHRFDKSDSNVFPITREDALMKALPQKHIKFYSFTSVRPSQSNLPVAEWFIEFPKRAYTDEHAWRTVVPKPKQLLGFTIEDISPA